MQSPSVSITNLTINLYESPRAPLPDIAAGTAVASAAAQFDTPAVGQPWPGQGGINGGFVPEHGDVPAHYLIFAHEDIGKHEWGGRNTESKATSRHDGKANTDILIAEGGHPAAEAARAHQADGNADFDLPAASQLYQAWVHGLITDGAYWSSTQRAANYAFYLDFGDGSQYGSAKYGALRVRPVRRFFI